MSGLRKLGAAALIASTLLFGVIESAPFQKTRLQPAAAKLAAGEE